MSIPTVSILILPSHLTTPPELPLFILQTNLLELQRNKYSLGMDFAFYVKSNI